VIFFPWYPAMMLAFEGSNVVDLGCGKLLVSATKQPMKADYGQGERRSFIRSGLGPAR
jgi:hypothetical protein